MRDRVVYLKAIEKVKDSISRSLTGMASKLDLNTFKVMLMANISVY